MEFKAGKLVESREDLGKRGVLEDDGVCGIDQVERRGGANGVEFIMVYGRLAVYRHLPCSG